MSDYKMSRVSRELFNNIKSFLDYKLFLKEVYEVLKSLNCT
ncbi:hypothetical protein HpBGD130_12600 [Helicobacter pylori]